MSVGSSADKFNTVSNDHGHTPKCDFPVLDRKYTFWVNLIQKIKIASLNWNLVPRLVRKSWIQLWYSFFLFFYQKNLFLSKFGPKGQNCQFKLKLLPRLFRIHRIQWWCSPFPISNWNSLLRHVWYKKPKFSV